VSLGSSFAAHDEVRGLLSSFSQSRSLLWLLLSFDGTAIWIESPSRALAPAAA